MAQNSVLIDDRQWASGEYDEGLEKIGTWKYFDLDGNLEHEENFYD